VTELQYSTVISTNDHMWNTGSQWYYDVGKSALNCVRSALATARGEPASFPDIPSAVRSSLATAHVEPTSILDLPSGHGRVCRMLRAAFPDAHLTVCDLDRDAVDFCAAEFNATPVYSQEDISSVSLDQSFDLIWCGSLFRIASNGQPFLGFSPTICRRMACSSSPPMDGSRSSGCEKDF